MPKLLLCICVAVDAAKFKANLGGKALVHITFRLLGTMPPLVPSPLITMDTALKIVYRAE